MYNSPIRNNKLLQEAYLKGYRQGLNEQQQGGPPSGRPWFTPSAPSAQRSMGGGGGIGGIDNRPKDDDGLEPDWFTEWMWAYGRQLFACGTDTACLNNIPWITCGIDGCFFGVEPYWRQFYPPSGPCNDFGCMW